MDSYLEVKEPESQRDECKSLSEKYTYREAHRQKKGNEYPDGLGRRETEKEDRIYSNGRGIEVRLVQE